MAVSYDDFLMGKTQFGSDEGFEPLFMPSCLFDFQSSLVDWSLRKGRAAIFADCGLGKTIIQLVWADNVVRKTNRPVLILTPLAVTYQTVAEAEKFGIKASRSRDGEIPKSPEIVVTNYERLHYFSPDNFAGVVCDESSILKSFDGSTRKSITDFMRTVPYRLLCTATAAPNDFTELGTSSEALGYLGHTDMLGRFFKNDNDTIRPFAFGLRNERGKRNGWRLKGHAELAFWRWVCSWARAIRKPSDIGFDDGAFDLPRLDEVEHIISPRKPAEGMLFTMPAIGLAEQRAERKRTLDERCGKVANIVNDTSSPALVWCNLNVEGNLLRSLISDATQISGSDSDEHKEEAFIGFTKGDIRVLITKPVIGAWGLNFQHCSHMTTFPTHSFEQHYQSVRRCWRFGQKNNVRLDMIVSEGEKPVIDNLKRKADNAAIMFSHLVSEMNRGMDISTKTVFNTKTEAPPWL